MKRRTMAFGGLLMAVAITGYSVAGTYAKYISSYGITDEARVAKWEFEVDNTKTTTVDLFQSSYTIEKDGTTYSYVASKDAAKVIAPGTSGSYSYAVTGSAEVNVKVSGGITLENNVKLTGIDPVTKAEVVQYDPLRFSIDGNEWLTSDEFNTKYGKASDTKVYPANYKFTTELGGSIQWKWAFDATEDSYIRDDLDTRLGELVVKEPTKYVVKASVSTTVEQTKDVPTVGKANVLPTVTNKMPADAAVEFATNWGYEADKAEGVVFNGYQLTGTIRPTSNPTANKMFPTDEQTNYFYTISIKGEAGQYLTYGGDDGALKNETFDGTNTQNIMITLNPDNTKRQKFLYNVYESKGGNLIGSYSIDYSGLTFATN